jgi:preprotein translocase subunit SecG
VYYFLLAVLILDAFLLMVIVLLQAGKGGGLAAMGGGGSETLLGGRQAATLLTRATWWTGAVFLTLCLVLSMMSRGVGRTDPVLRELQTRPGTAAPALPGIGEPTAPTSGQLAPGSPDVQTGPATLPTPAPDQP